ncbi:MAG TPA: hypothetical protein PLO65_07860 [Caulobacter sp.]|nr:hypothetical protein [Caulobacter sp.]
MARRVNIRPPQPRDARLKTLMRRMKLAAARVTVLPAAAAV